MSEEKYSEEILRIKTIFNSLSEGERIWLPKNPEEKLADHLRVFFYKEAKESILDHRFINTHLKLFCTEDPYRAWWSERLEYDFSDRLNTYETLEIAGAGWAKNGKNEGDFPYIDFIPKGFVFDNKSFEEKQKVCQAILKGHFHQALFSYISACALQTRSGLYVDISNKNQIQEIEPLQV